MKPKVSHKKRSKTERYWELFGAFCISGNTPGTYAELIQRVKWFNENQELLRKIPPSASPKCACMCVNARKSFFGTPRACPDTLYDYRRLLAKNFYYFAVWLQDSFGIHFAEADVHSLFHILSPVLPRRFAQISPRAHAVEQKAACLKALAATGGELNLDWLHDVDEFRKDNPVAFCRLRALLDVEGQPMFAPGDVEKTPTDAIFTRAAKHDTAERFYWEGKDIARYLFELPEPAISKLVYKQDIFDDDEVAKKAFSTHVHRVEPSDADAQKLDMEKNHYIEGDNMRALKLLAPTYTGKIKMVYIDPPYNTGHDFVYKDKFRESVELYRRFLLRPIPRERPKGEPK